mmetsp:Transcript_115507/g.224713  ORF Transcript_115507/g.224713 Transcript_115507/m.224713 type:complete len:350 (+) Transcript_115507:305-1354(+)
MPARLLLRLLSMRLLLPSLRAPRSLLPRSRRRRRPLSPACSAPLAPASLPPCRRRLRPPAVWRRLRRRLRLRSLWLSWLALRSAAARRSRRLARRARHWLGLPLRPPSFSALEEDDEAVEPEPLSSSEPSLSSSSSLLSFDCELRPELDCFSDLLRRLWCLDSFSSAPVSSAIIFFSFSCFFFLPCFSGALLSAAMSSSSLPAFLSFLSFLCFTARRSISSSRPLLLLPPPGPTSVPKEVDSPHAAPRPPVPNEFVDKSGAEPRVSGTRGRSLAMALIPSGSAASGIERSDASSERDAIRVRSSLFSESSSPQRAASSERYATLARNSSHRVASFVNEATLACNSVFSV